MVLCRFIFLLIFIPSVIGLIEKVPEVPDNKSSTVAPKAKSLQEKDNNTSKSVTLPVEGGSIVIPPSNVSLINENDAVQLPKLPSEDLEESHTKNKGHVVGRTGAPISVEFRDVSTKAPISKNSTFVNKLTSTRVSTTTKAVSSTTKPTVSPKSKPHKPPVLKYQEPSIVADKTLSFGISEGTPTTQANKPGSHPGMIMPVVITILIVPLFAVLGYMALKRGQEAWKNRHYKRMDFLLDGMYND